MYVGNEYASLGRTAQEPWPRQRVVKQRFLGIGLSLITRAAVLEIIEHSLRTRSKLTISILNPNYIVFANRHPEVIQFMNAFDIMLADGIGVVLGARFLGIPIPERLGNDDFGADLFGLCAINGYSNFLFGSAPGVGERAAANLKQSFPTLRLCGTLHGLWFDSSQEGTNWCTSEDNATILRQVNTSHADVLWVGLSTPLQQRWVYENRERINSTVIITCGGYLDHVAERVNWYPPFFYKLRLSWLYRLLREPRRLWRRYSIEILEFALLLARSKLLGARHRHQVPNSD